MLTLDEVLLEADGVNVDASPDKMNESEREDRRTNDYSYNEEDDTVTDEDTDAGNEGSNDDTNAEDNAEEPNPDEGDAGDAEDNAGGDEEDNDYSSDMNNDEGGLEDDGNADDSESASDSAGDDGMADSDSTNAVENEDQLKERHTKVKSLLLLKDMIKLYQTVKGFAKKVMSLEKQNVLFSTIQNNTADNFMRLKEIIYNYINFYYDHMSYEYNLYTYNYFIEACKVNLEILGKVINKDEVIY